jgi:hypothetical protein
MEQTPPGQRRLIGCGYLPLLASAQPWDGAELGRVPQSDELEQVDPAGHPPRLRLPVCPGYACALPEVVEASHAILFKKDGELTQFCGGQATPELLRAITELEIQQAQVVAARRRREKERQER